MGDRFGITQITPAGLQTETDAFVASYSDFNAARSARQAVSDTYRAAETALTEWLFVVAQGPRRAVRQPLVHHVGAGWIHQSQHGGAASH